MKKSTRIILVVLCCIMIALCATGVIWAFVNKFSQTVEADYLDIYENENAIVNFNQLYNYDLNNVNFTAGSFKVINNATFNVVQNHIYYVYITNINSNINYIKIWGNNLATNVLDAPNSYARFKSLYSFNDCKFEMRSSQGGYNTFYINVIDLSSMFGLGSEPDLSQCQELFIADHYYYSSGTPMSIYGITYYNAAYQDILKSYKYNLDINALGINTFAYRLDNHTADFFYSNESGGYWGMLNCIGIPLFTTLNSGASFSIRSMFVLPNVPDQYYSVCFAYLDDKNNMIELYRNVITSNEMTTYEFILNTDIDTIYMYFRITDTGSKVYDTSFNIWNLTVSATQLDINSMVINANQSGQTIGYRAGYQAGYQAGLANTNGTLGTMEYVSAAFTGIGEILQIELLPNVPFSLFILLPLMFGLISFVIKLTKGGGGD